MGEYLGQSLVVSDLKMIIFIGLQESYDSREHFTNSLLQNLVFVAILITFLVAIKCPSIRIHLRCISPAKNSSCVKVGVMPSSRGPELLLGKLP